MTVRARETAALREHARATPSALRLRSGLPFDDWLSVGRHISRISSASAWWLGDWIVYGRRSYRDRYAAALAATPLDYQTLRNYAWVAGRVEMSRRRDNLSFQHHAEVAALPEADQEIWLQRAERLHWSRSELRQQLAAKRRRERGASAANSSAVVRLNVPRLRERRWREAALVAHQGLSDWIAAAADDAARALLSAESSASGETDGR